MIKHEYSTVVEVGDLYEFCIQESNKPSQVLYGKVISINSDAKTFDFMMCNNSIKKGKFVATETGEVYKNVDAVRGIMNP